MIEIKKTGENGNALFLILIAVALFAALSYAITQSGRGGGTVDRETSLIAAGQVVEFPATVKTAVTRMMITGTPASGATGISLDTTPAGNTYEVFDPAGGGMTNVPPPTSSGATAWTYVDATAAANGFYVKDVGTNTSVTGREVMAVATGITLTVCEQINKGLGQASPYTPEAVAVAMNWAATLATYDVAAANTLSGGANIDGESFSCVNNDTGGAAAGPYHYYHVLIQQ